MVKYLSMYKGEYKIFVISESNETTQALLGKGLCAGEIRGNTLIILPENTVTPITDSEREKLEVLHEYDVVEINSQGIIYRWYSRADGDAGIAVTPQCNSNCIMCPAGDNERRNAGNITLKQIDTVLKHFPKDIWYFTITGGEPTLVGEDNFIHILNSVKTELPDTKILLLTNGRTLGDREFFEKFADARPRWLRVAVPIHGSTAEKHDSITRSPGSFGQTMRGISNLLRTGIESEIRIIVSKANCDDITDIAKLVVNSFPSVTVVNFVGLEMRGNCVVYPDEVLLSYQDAFAKSLDAVNLLINSGINVGLYNFPYCMIDENYWPIAQKSISAYKSMFYPECSECSLRGECCGIFLATMNYYKPKVYPIKSESRI